METEAKKLFTSTLQELISSLLSLTEEELNAKPDSGGWTVAQVGDHLLNSYGVVNVLKGKGIETEKDPAGKVPVIKHQFLYNTTKTTSPEGILPSTEYIAKEKLIKDLRIRFREFEEVIEQKDLTKIAVGYELPVLGALTRLEWIYFTSYHTQRHIQQIKKINAQFDKLCRA